MLYRTTFIAILALTACAGEGSVGGADEGPQETDADTDTDTDSDTDTDVVEPPDTSLDTGTPPDGEALTLDVTRDGLDLVVTFTSDGAGPWSIEALGLVVEVAAPGEHRFAFDPCTALGTVVPVAVVGEGVIEHDFELVGSVVQQGDTGPGSANIDATALDFPVAICGGSTASEADVDGFIVRLPSVGAWSLALIDEGYDLNIEEFGYEHTYGDPETVAIESGDAFSVTVLASAIQPVNQPIPFTLFVDEG